MTPLTMTAEEEAYRRAVAVDPAGTGVQVYEILRKAFAEVDALRAQLGTARKLNAIL